MVSLTLCQQCELTVNLLKNFSFPHLAWPLGPWDFARLDSREFKGLISKPTLTWNCFQKFKNPCKVGLLARYHAFLFWSCFAIVFDKDFLGEFFFWDNCTVGPCGIS
jgi:hypothetical protein